MNVQLLHQSACKYFVLKDEEGLIFNISEVSFVSGRSAGSHNEELEVLLKELVNRAGARGGLLAFRKSYNRKSVRAGQIRKNVSLTPNDKRLLKQGKVFVKNGFFIQPVRHKNKTAGIICIKCDDEKCLASCKNLVHAYALLVENELELSSKKKMSSKSVQVLQDKKRELEEVQQYNQNLLRITAHDLSSPLNAVSGYLEMIEDFLTKDESKQKLKHYFRRVQSGVNDITDMLMQLNEIIKYKEGRLALNSVRVDANWIVHDVCDLLKAVANKKNIELRVNPGKVPAYIEVDIVKFKRIVYNLVSNAIKYSDDKKCININIRSNNDLVEVHIKDEGKGIPEAEMDTIFQPFVEFKSNEDDVFSKGLGLYISSYFVELMDGTIEAKSKPGKGSTFIIAMPEVCAPSLQSKSA